MNKARLLSIVVAAIVVGASARASAAPTMRPEDGYLSSSRYLSAFFGFVLPIPKDLNLIPAPVSEIQGSTRWMLALKTMPATHEVSVTISAEPAPKKGDIRATLQSDFPDAYGGMGKPERVDIGGQKFWKIRVPATPQADLLNIVEYGGIVRDYLMRIRITRMGEIPQEFMKFVEGSTFVPPAEIAAQRTADMVEYYGPALPPLGKATAAIAKLQSGVMVGGEYRNDALGIAFRIPPGLQPRTPQHVIDDINSGGGMAEAKDKGSPIERQIELTCTRELFFADDGKRSVDGHSNVALTITAIDPICLQGAYFPASIADTAALQALVNILANRIPSGRPGLKMDGRARRIDDHMFVVISGVFYGTEPGTGLKILNRIRLIATEWNGYVVTWTFVAPDQQAMEDIASGTVRFYRAENETGGAGSPSAAVHTNN